MTELLQRLQSELAARYRIEGEVAEGGMAFVFRATDLKHDRKVAVKVLRPELSAMVGADRFLREIRVTAQLQHPHILPLYDSGSAAELLYYVMPFIDGESLRDRLRRERQLAVDETVSIVGAIASALDYAHRQGVLHRDIKPENILLQDRQPLLADFGIALAVKAAGGDRLTVSGLAIGTPSYMSPEQIAGEKSLDARSDIYSLGCVAYEMLAGEPPFTGPNLQAVMASVMTSAPKPIEETRRTVPVGVAAAIHRAMQPLPADRYHTAADFAAAMTTDATLRAPRRRSSWRPAAFLAAGATAGALLGFLAARLGTPVAHPAVRRLSIVLPDSSPAALAGAGSTSDRQKSIALSPSGDRLAYVALRGNTTVLAVRPLDGDSVIVFPGTEGAYYPFFSPDGAWIGFFSGNTLRKVPAAGGNPVNLVAVDRITGASWVSTDRILVFENEGFDLHWVSASGARADTTMHLTTQFGTADILDGGEWAVGQLSSGQLALLSLRSGLELAITRRGVLPLDSVRQADLLFGTSPRWLSSGHLIYGDGDGALMAMPFDGSKRRVLGESVLVLSGMQMEAGFGYAEFALSRDGTLVYIPGHNQLYVNIAFVSPSGKIDTLPFPRGQYTQPRLSPDGTQLAVQARNPVSGWEMLLMNLATGLRRQVEVQGNFRPFPASWLPSGHELLVGLWDPVQFLNYGARIQSLDDGTWTDIHVPGASYMTVSPDGRSFVFSDWRSGDLFIRSLRADTTRTRIPARGFAASFSPDGRWVAWGDVNGAVEASPVPPTGAIYPVAERGEMPLWTPKGDGVIFRDHYRYFVVPIETASGFRAGRPRLLVEGPFISTFAWNHDIARDGRLLVLLSSPAKIARTLGVITGFASAVERVAPARAAAR